MLKGMNVVLTGANRGIGNAILCKLAENHANVWCLVRSIEQDFREQTDQLMRECGIWIKLIRIDLEKEESIRRAVQSVVNDRMQIDALINNAGINYRNSFLMTSRSDMEKLYAVNYFAGIQLIQLFAKRMITRRKGNVINITSASGFENNVGNFAYANVAL